MKKLNLHPVQLFKRNKLIIFIFLFGVLIPLSFYIPDAVLSLVALTSLGFAYYEFEIKRRPYIYVELSSVVLEEGPFKYQFWCALKNVGNTPGYAEITKAEIHIGNQITPTPISATPLLQPGELGRKFDVGFLTQEAFDLADNNQGRQHSVVFIIELKFKDILSKDYKYKSSYRYHIKNSNGQLIIAIITENTN